MNFKSKIKSQNSAKNQNKKIFKNLYTLFNGIERALDAFENAIFPIKKIEGTGFSDFGDFNLRILTPKEMLQTLPIALPQLKVGNTFKDLLGFLCQIIYSLHRAKGITSKVCNNIMSSITL